ncbi:MAG: hypothetical protein J3Q66DRAFT_332977 [Benniella sp.]|nr:MAG: hypothetical protein J3Q66DRAFT_332977 [Benniella sp.]
MPRSGRQSVSSAGVTPAAELPAVDNALVGEGQEETLVEGDSFELVDGDDRPNYDSTTEDSDYTYERIDGEDSDDGVGVTDGGEHRLEATWARALMGYPLKHLDGRWVVSTLAELHGLSLSREISDVLVRDLKWQRARVAQQLLIKEYRTTLIGEMVGAPRVEGREIDEEGYRAEVGKLTAQIEEIERLGRYVEQALSMHRDRERHEWMEVPLIRHDQDWYVTACPLPVRPQLFSLVFRVEIKDRQHLVSTQR